MTVIERDSPPLYVRIGTEHYQRTGLAPGPSPRGTVVEVVPVSQLQGAVEQNEHLLHGICDALKHMPPSTESAGTAILHSLLRGTSHDHGRGQ